MGKKTITVKCSACGKYVSTEVSYFGFCGLTIGDVPTGTVACPHCGHLIHYYVP